MATTTTVMPVSPTPAPAPSTGLSAGAVVGAVVATVAVAAVGTLIVKDAMNWAQNKSHWTPGGGGSTKHSFKLTFQPGTPYHTWGGDESWTAFITSDTGDNSMTGNWVCWFADTGDPNAEQQRWNIADPDGWPAPQCNGPGITIMPSYPTDGLQAGNRKYYARAVMHDAHGVQVGETDPQMFQIYFGL